MPNDHDLGARIRQSLSSRRISFVLQPRGGFKMLTRVSPRAIRGIARRKLSLDLFCSLVLIGALSRVVKSDSLQAWLGAPIKRSVSVSTSAVSSLRVEPPVAQVVARTSQDDTTSDQQQQQQQPKAPELSKIRDYSKGEPIELAREERRRRLPQHQPALVSPPFQLLQARRAGDVQPAGVSAINQPEHRHIARAVEAGGQSHTSQLAPQAASEERGLKSVLRGGVLWLGSNVLAALIPLASLLGLSSFASAGASASQGGAPGNNQTRRNWLAERLSSSLASLADGQQLVSALSAGSGSGGPVGNAGIQSRVEYVMGWLERSVEHLPNFPRLHPQECVKRSICEAHHEPLKYGAVGLTLRLLFPASPATANGTNAGLPMDNMEYKVINKYRHAAGYGLSRRLEGGSAGEPVCKEKYDDCLVSLLEVGQKLIDFFLR